MVNSVLTGKNKISKVVKVLYGSPDFSKLIHSCFLSCTCTWCICFWPT